MWYILFIQFLFLTINSLFAEQQFPLIDFSLNNVWIASNQLAIKDAMYGFFEPTLKPVALPPKLTINYQKDQPNPLLGQSPLIFKTINDNYHVIITESKPADLYLLDTRLTE